MNRLCICCTKDDGLPKTSYLFDRNLKVTKIKVRKLKLPTKEVASGASGKVYLGIWKREGALLPVAVKKWHHSGKAEKIEFQTELRLLDKSRHERVVTLYGYVDKADKLWIIQELMNGGSLRAFESKRLKDGRPLDLAEKVTIFTQIADGLVHMYDKGVIHRDLNTNNIFIREEEGILVAKIGDLGNAEEIKDDMERAFESRSRDIPAFGAMLASAFGLCFSQDNKQGGTPESPTIQSLREIAIRCDANENASRPMFRDVFEQLKRVHANVIGDYISCVRFHRLINSLSKSAAYRIMMTGSNVEEMTRIMESFGLGAHNESENGRALSIRNITIQQRTLESLNVTSFSTDGKFHGCIYVLDKNTDVSTLKPLIDKSCLDKASILVLEKKTDNAPMDVGKLETAKAALSKQNVRVQLIGSERENVEDSIAWLFLQLVTVKIA